MKGLVSAFILMLSAMATAVQAQPLSIHGLLHINAVLTATSTPDPYVKEGHPKQENWQIVQNGDQATLTTPSGSIQGRFLSQTHEFPQGVWRFEVMVPNFLGQPSLGAKFEVVLQPRSINVLSGGSTVTYYSINMLGGSWVPAGMESWRFDATRLQ